MKLKKLVSIICTFGMLFFAIGCQRVQTVTEYPTTVHTNGEADNKNDEEAEVPSTETEEEKLVTDSLRTNGKFYYNPTLLNPVYKDHISEELQTEARMIMEAAYNHDLTIDFSNMKSDYSSVNLATELAMLSSPFCEEISLEDDGNGVYRVVYLYEEQVMKEKVAAYEQIITDMINERISSTATDAERAKIVYKWLIEEFEFDYDSLGNQETLTETDSEYERVDDITFVEQKHGDLYNFVYTYVLILHQLGIESNLMGSMGYYEMQGSDKLDELMSPEKTYFYDMFCIDDTWYYCDLFFEKVVYDEDKEKYPETECEFTYFGMGDETRSKSWHPQYKRPVFNLVATKSPGMPECPEDLVF